MPGLRSAGCQAAARRPRPAITVSVAGMIHAALTAPAAAPAAIPAKDADRHAHGCPAGPRSLAAETAARGGRRRPRRGSRRCPPPAPASTPRRPRSRRRRGSGCVGECHDVRVEHRHGHRHVVAVRADAHPVRGIPGGRHAPGSPETRALAASGMVTANGHAPSGRCGRRCGPTRSAPTKASVARTPHAVPKRCPYSKTDDPPTIGSDTVLFAGFTVSSVPGNGRSV